MKLTLLPLLFSSVSAFSSFGAKQPVKEVVSESTLSIDTLPGAIAPVGFFDPLSFLFAHFDFFDRFCDF